MGGWSNLVLKHFSIFLDALQMCRLFPSTVIFRHRLSMYFLNKNLILWVTDYHSPFTVEIPRLWRSITRETGKNSRYPDQLHQDTEGRPRPRFFQSSPCNSNLQSSWEPCTTYRKFRFYTHGDLKVVEKRLEPESLTCARTLCCLFNITPHCSTGINVHTRESPSGLSFLPCRLDMLTFFLCIGSIWIHLSLSHAN